MYHPNLTIDENLGTIRDWDSYSEFHKDLHNRLEALAKASMPIYVDGELDTDRWAWWMAATAKLGLLHGNPNALRQAYYLTLWAYGRS